MNRAQAQQLLQTALANPPPNSVMDSGRPLMHW